MKTSDRIKKYMKLKKKEGLKKKKKPLFKVGEVAIIKRTEKENSGRHKFIKGQKVIITSIERPSKGSWFYIAMLNKSFETEDWAVIDEELVKIEK